MKDVLSQFENRSDDWLASERRHEATVSAWDFDEGRKIKESHRDNCDAEEIKQSHEINCDARSVRNESVFISDENHHQKRTHKASTLYGEELKENKKTDLRKVSLIIGLLFFTLPLVFVIDAITGVSLYPFVVICFVLLVFSSNKSKKRRR